MEFSLFGKQYYVGRKRNVPIPVTSLIYAPNGYTITNLDNTIDKQMTSVMLRNFAKTPVCRRAINIIKNGILNCPWRIEKVDMNDKNDYSVAIDTVTRCLNQPNNGDSFDSLFGAAIEDILTGDCGAIEVCMGNSEQRPVFLYPVDGFTIRVGLNRVTKPTDIKYRQRKVDGSEAELAEQDLMYMKASSFTYTPLGVAPVEAAFKLVNYLLEAQSYAALLASKSIPKFLIDLGEDATAQEVIAFRKYFKEEIYGTGNIPIAGGSKGIKGQQIAPAGDDGLYLQWQHFLTVIIAYTFGVDPKRFNEGSQTDRSTVAEQKENILDEAIKPIASVIEEQINRKILARLGLAGKLRFVFVFEDSESRKKMKSDRVLQEYNGDLLTLNEARQMLGYDKVENPYGEMLKSAYKVELNITYAERTAELQTQNAGGYNGVGKDRYDNVDDDRDGDDTNNE